MKYLILLLIVFYAFSACRETPEFITIVEPVENDTPPGLDCILPKDENGATIRSLTNCDPIGQWIYTNLNSEELQLLNFPDTISTPLASDVKVRRGYAYPNPISQDQPLNIGFSQIYQNQVKVKLAVVNAKTLTVQRTTLLSNGLESVSLNISSNLYNSGEYYRVYFQVLGDQNKIFVEGYGNIFVCKNASPETIEDCF